MAAGDYEFATTQKETMTVVSGTLIVKLPDAADWQTFNSGDSFIVEARQGFQLQVRSHMTAYLCTYEQVHLYRALRPASN